MALGKGSGQALVKSAPLSIDTAVRELAMSGSEELRKRVLEKFLDQCETPEEAIELINKLTSACEDYERRHLASLTKRTDAIIDAKNRDPDEIDRRKDATTRRSLALIFGAAGAVSVIGALGLAIFASVPAVFATGLVVVGGVCLGSAGPMYVGKPLDGKELISMIKELARLRGNKKKGGG
jgi:hypothetical protein